MFRRWWWILLVMAVAGPILGFLGAAAVSYVMPRKYESVAVMQVMRGHDQMAPGGGTEPMHSMPSRFLATEMEVIRAEKTIERVVDALNLATRWGTERGQAIGIVRTMVKVQQIRDTDLIQICVRHTNAEDARDIAMAVASAYRDRRAEFGRERAEHELAGLNKVLREQEDGLEVRRKTLYEVLDSMKGDGDPSDAPVARQRYLAAQQDYDAEISQLEKMRIETQGKRIELGLPSNPVVIHEQPTLARTPVSPNVSFNLVIGLLAGVPIGLLLALPLIMMVDGIAGRKNDDPRGQGALFTGRIP